MARKVIPQLRFQSVDVLPGTADGGQIVYLVPEGKFYFGNGTGWFSPSPGTKIVSALPSSGIAGEIYYETATGKFFFVDVTDNFREAFLAGAVLPPSGGGTGISTFAKGDLLVATDAGTLAKLSAGANGKVLSANSGTATGLQWIDPPSGGGNVTPDAPTSGVVDDTANTFGFTNSTGYVMADHEYSTDSGTTYAPVTANPIAIGNVALAIGAVKVRVAAATGRNVSADLSNATAFTASSGGNVTWNNTTSATIAGSSITHAKTQYYCRANSDQSIAASGSGYFSWDAKNGQIGSGTNYGMNATKICLIPSANYPFTTGTPDSIATLMLTPSNNVVTILKNNAYASDITFNDTDTITMGFDGSGHLQVKKNGVAAWTDGATTAAGNYYFYVQIGDDGSGIGGLENVIYG